MKNISENRQNVNNEKLALLLANAELNIDAHMIIKASKKLADEIIDELNIDDPVDAKELISKNRVLDE